MIVFLSHLRKGIGKGSQKGKGKKKRTKTREKGKNHGGEKSHQGGGALVTPQKGQKWREKKPERYLLLFLGRGGAGEYGKKNWFWGKRKMEGESCGRRREKPLSSKRGSAFSFDWVKYPGNRCKENTPKACSVKR